MQQLSASYHVDFDTWAELAQKDPESFEKLRERFLDLCIGRATEERQQRLRCLQWRINQVRDLASNPLSACISISDMMWDTFVNLDQAYEDMTRSRKAKPPAKLLQFPGSDSE